MRQHLQTVNDSGTRAAEIVRAVRDIYPTRPHRRQVLQPGDGPKKRQIAKSYGHSDPVPMRELPLAGSRF